MSVLDAMRPWMRSVRSTLGGVVAVAALGGCDADLILSGNFDDWPVDLVEGPIPGAPLGDEVTIIETIDEFPPAVATADRFWFRDTACPTGEDCDAAPGRLMFFTSAPVDAAQRDNALTLSITGDAPFAPNTTMDLRLFEGHFRTLAGLRFRRGIGSNVQVSVLHGDGRDPFTTVSLLQRFNVLVEVEPEAGTFEVIQGSNAGEFPLVEPPSSQRFKGVSLQYVNPVATASTFRLNDLLLYVARE